MAAKVLTVTGHTVIRTCVARCQIRQGTGWIMTGLTRIMLLVVKWGNYHAACCSLSAVMAGATVGRQGNCR